MNSSAKFFLFVTLFAAISSPSVKCDVSHLPLTSYTCQETYSAEKFTISLPERSRPETFECRFTVNSYSSDVCRLRINFVKFGLLSSPSCRDQYLNVNDRIICGSLFGKQQFPFPGNSTVLYYRSDGIHPLEIEVEQVRCRTQGLSKSCDVTSSAQWTEITSPNYPSPYPSPLTCLYTVRPPTEGSCQLVVRFHDFLIQESENCLTGRLLLDGVPYCGQKTGFTFYKNTTNGLQFEFSHGSSQSIGGFRISVEQIPCSLNIRRNISENQVVSYPSLCCNKIFNTQNILLTSPGFLLLQNPSDTSCLYQIQQAGPQFCRLRFNFLHFWVGQEDVYYGCIDGYLEIDGRRYCGCKDGLSIVSFFDNPRKDLLFSSRGVKGRGFIVEVHQEDCTSFVGRSNSEPEAINPNNEVEIFSTNATVEKVQSRFFVPSTDSRCSQWSLPQFVDKIRAILQSAPNLCPISKSPIPENPIIPPPGLYLPPIGNPPLLRPPSGNPIVPPSCYPPLQPPVQNPIIPPPFSPPLRPPAQNPTIPPPFLPPLRPPAQNPINPPPIFPPFQPPVQNPIIPPPVYPPFQPPVQNPIIPPAFYPPLLPPAQNPIIPPPVYPPLRPPAQNPIFPPPNLIPKPPIFPPVNPTIRPPTYPPQPPIYPPSQCRIFVNLDGSFQSPGYPWNYPAHQKCCFRVRQSRGFCRLQLSILDFDISWSPKCWKDYLLLDGKARYCGSSLQSSVSYLPFRNGYASIDFVSDGFFSSRGFRAAFRQLPCHFIQRSDPEPLPPAPYPPAGGRPQTTPRPFPPIFTTTTEFNLGVTSV